MQERVVEQHDAERVEQSWYLTRDGKQIGPLTDRELSLFADGGNFKEGDLLWTAGLDSWKPAEAIFGLTPSSEAEKTDSVQPNGKTADAVFEIPPTQNAEKSDLVDPADEPADGPADAAFDASPSPDADPEEPSEPHGEDVDALVQALKGQTEPAKPTLQYRALLELKKFAGFFVYLWVVFTVFLLHEWIVLSENHIGFKFYGLATINALVLAKFMLVAEHFRFAEKLKEKPLIHPILYKTVAFTTLLLAVYVLEKMLVGWLSGNGFLASVPAVGGGLVGALTLWLIFCVALLPFFAFKELERAVGPDMIRTLLLGRRGSRGA